MHRLSMSRLVSLLLALLLGAAGATALAPAASAAPTPNYDLTGTWNGTITWPIGGPRPMSVTISSNNPLRAEQQMNANSQCTSIWIEKSRNADGTITVLDEVQNGNCGANTADWIITIAGRDRITGYTPADPSITFDIRRDVSCAKSVARISEDLPPGYEAAAAALLKRVYGIPEWIGTTTLSITCILEALEGNSPVGQAPDIWGNINSPDFFEAVCLTGEALLDPLNLGYSRGLFCGMSAG